MHRPVCLFLVLCALLAFVPAVSDAQDPKFTTCTVTTLAGFPVVTGQIAGLGQQTEPLGLDVTATAVCVDPTTAPPTLGNTATLTDSVTYPPKNGNRKFVVVVNEPFVLLCTPPQEMVFVATQVCDTTHGICCTPPFPAPEPEPEPEPESQPLPQ